MFEIYLKITGLGHLYLPVFIGLHALVTVLFCLVIDSFLSYTTIDDDGNIFLALLATISIWILIVSLAYYVSFSAFGVEMITVFEAMGICVSPRGV